jgi:hypothetical protein
MIHSSDLKSWLRLLPAGFSVGADGTIIGTDGTQITVTGPAAKTVGTLLLQVHEVIERAEDFDLMRKSCEVATDVAYHADDVMEHMLNNCTCGAKDGLGKEDR